MDIKLIHHLARIMKRADLSELEVDDTQSGLRVHLVRGGRETPGSPLVHVMQGGAMPGGPLAPGAGYGAPAGVGAPSAGSGVTVETRRGAAERELPPGVVAFKSPMVGTFYRAASPDAEPFADVGTRLKEDSVLCIVEAMKVMNEIRAELAGTVVEVLVQNAEPVEFGQPLFLIQKS